MSRASAQKFTRKAHRFLGMFVGIQLFFWSLSGVYFTWTDIDDIHGDFESKLAEPKSIIAQENWVNINDLIAKSDLKEIATISVREFMGTQYIMLMTGKNNCEMYDSITGERMAPITKETAVKIAEEDFTGDGKVVNVLYVEKTGGEYAGAVPAWRVDFDYWKNNHIYVNAMNGEISARRHKLWRAFDFLWMLHIMDYEGREDFNHWLIRIVSLMGLISTVSGIALWGLTTKYFRPRSNRQ